MIVGSVRRFDDRIDGLVDRIRGRPGLDRLFYWASTAGDHGMVWIALGLLRGLRGDALARPAALRLVMAIAAESVVVNIGIKSLFRRGRPVHHGDRPRRLRQPVTSAFPSGHATAGFTAAALLTDGDPLLAPLYYGVAVVVAGSRIYVKIHHASDVVGGVLIGAVLGRIGVWIWPLREGLRGLGR